MQDALMKKKNQVMQRVQRNSRLYRQICAHVEAKSIFIMLAKIPGLMGNLRTAAEWSALAPPPHSVVALRQRLRKRRFFSSKTEGRCATIQRTVKDHICVLMSADYVQEGRGSLTGPAGSSIQQLLQRIRSFQFRLLLLGFLLGGYFAGRRRVVLHQLFGQDVGHCVAGSSVIGWERQKRVR